MGTRVGIVTGRVTAPNRNSDLSVRLLQVQLTDLMDVQTVQLVEQSGEESSPPLGSLVTVVNGGQAFKLAVGVDDGIEPIMDPGGKRLYSIDPATHKVIAELKFDPDGTVTETTPNCTRVTAPDGTFTLTNPGATITVSPAGVITINAPTVNMTGDLNVDGTITAPDIVGTTSVIAPLVTGSTQVVFGGKDATTHIHSGVQTGVDNTGVPV